MAPRSRELKASPPLDTCALTSRALSHLDKPPAASTAESSSGCPDVSPVIGEVIAVFRSRSVAAFRAWHLPRSTGGHLVENAQRCSALRLCEVGGELTRDRCNRRRYDAGLHKAPQRSVLGARRQAAACIEDDLHLKPVCCTRQGRMLHDDLCRNTGDEQCLPPGLHDRIARSVVREGVGRCSFVLRQLPERGSDLGRDARAAFGRGSRDDRWNLEKLRKFRERADRSAQSRWLVCSSELDDARLEICEQDDGVLRIERCVVHGIFYFGQGAPASTHCWNLATNSACGMETGLRPRPGSQPQSTSLSWFTCSSSASRSLPPLVFGFLIVRQRSPLDSPMKTIFLSGGGRCQFGAPGGMCSP